MNCFAKIKEINGQMQGWCTEQKALTLASLVIALRPKISIEIGVYGGRSLVPIALAHKEVGGFCYGIDPWTTQAATEGYVGENKEWWNRQEMLNEALRSTLEWIRKTDVQGFCQIIRSRSDEFEPPVGVGLLHVDGQHSEVCQKDVLRYTPNMAAGSVVVMDDITWTNAGVNHVGQAINWMESHGWRKMYDLDTGAVFQKE